MLPSRFVPGQQDSKRKDGKSRLDVRPSMLPKPRRPFSTERQSIEMRYPNTAGQRSSSAEPPRHTISGPRLSREASASKLPRNPRPRSQQGDRFMTPLRSSQYPGSMTTPRTPSEDRGTRKWQTCLERALAFVTIRDERPLADPSWQRSEYVRAAEALAEREGRTLSDGGAVGAYAAGGGAKALVRPLTIARFVDITGALLKALNSDLKLTTDNYVTKLPHLTKRLLYPGTVSKSWLKTVNTLHAFPQALALIVYLLDLVNHVELPVTDECLYKDKDELSCLRRSYVYQCFSRFQDPTTRYDDIDEEYLRNLKSLLGCEDDKFEELNKTIKKYQECLEDEEELAAQAEEARRADRSAAAAGALKEARAERSRCRSALDALLQGNKRDQLTALDQDIERASGEKSRLVGELDGQEMTVPERTRLLDEIDYAARVRDSKEALAQQVAKMVQNKETELSLWQKRSLESCVEYKQGLIHLSAQFPRLAALAVDEKELMDAECAARLSAAVDALREFAAQLAERRAEHARNKTKLARKRTVLLEEIRTKITDTKSSVEREQQALDSELSKEKEEAAAWNLQLQDINTRLQELRSNQEQHLQVDRDHCHLKQMEDTMEKKLSELEEYVQSQREKSTRLVRAAAARRVRSVLDNINEWNEILQK